MTPADFVKQVLSLQEQTYLDDFAPDTDIYKMVLLNANLVIQEFQDEALWNFLRCRIVLGNTDPSPKGHHIIPEYILPPYIDKISTLYQDRLTLHAYKRHCCDPDNITLNDIDWRAYPIEVPFQSKGAGRHIQRDYGNNLNWNPEIIEPLKALNIGRIITFNRALTHHESYRAVVLDAQKSIPLLHICDDKCKDKKGNTPSYYPDDYRPCTKIEKSILDMIPSPDYIVLKTATYSADGSEIAQDKAMKLADRAKSKLSRMREIDSAATDVDQIEFEPFSIIQV